MTDQVFSTRIKVSLLGHKSVCNFSATMPSCKQRTKWLGQEVKTVHLGLSSLLRPGGFRNVQTSETKAISHHGKAESGRTFV